MTSDITSYHNIIISFFRQTAVRQSHSTRVICTKYNLYSWTITQYYFFVEGTLSTDTTSHSWIIDTKYIIIYSSCDRRDIYGVPILHGKSNSRDTRIFLLSCHFGFRLCNNLNLIHILLLLLHVLLYSRACGSTSRTCRVK